MQAGLLERVRCGAGILACLPGGQLLEGPCAASAVGCEYGLPAGCYIPMLVRASLNCMQHCLDAPPKRVNCSGWKAACSNAGSIRAFLQIAWLSCIGHLEAHAKQLAQQCHVAMRCISEPGTGFSSASTVCYAVVGYSSRMTGREYCQASRARKLLRTHRKHPLDRDSHLRHSLKLCCGLTADSGTCTADCKLELPEDPTSRLDAERNLARCNCLSDCFPLLPHCDSLQCMNKNLLASKNSCFGRQLCLEDPRQNPLFKQQLLAITALHVILRRTWRLNMVMQLSAFYQYCQGGRGRMFLTTFFETRPRILCNLT